MPALRQRKRAASPAGDAQAAADPPKKQAKRGKAKAEPISDDADGPAVDAPTSQTSKKQAKSKTSKADVEVDGSQAQPGKASRAKKVKAKSESTIKSDPGAGSAQSQHEEPDDEDPKSSKAQYATSSNVVIPVDEGCSLPGVQKYHVFVDASDGIIYDAALNQTNAGDNANKFYRLQLLTNGKGAFTTWTRWGRVGERGQSAALGAGSLDSALSNFEKKFKDKTGLKWSDRTKDPKPGKYVFVERSYEPESEDEKPKAKTKQEEGDSKPKKPLECTLKAPVKSLMELIFNQQHMASTMADLNYDANKMPLGKLSKATILRGYQALKKLAALLDDNSLAVSEYNSTFSAMTEELSNTYYSFIPHAFGRNRPPIISSNDHLKKEVELLDSLTDLKDADAILKKVKESDNEDTAHPLDARYNGLGMREVTPLEHDTSEFANISEYLVKTCGATHGISYEVVDIFRIERQGETDRFRDSSYASIPSDRRLLWHGSRSTNYGGILSQGLRIAPPEAPVSGYMFGKGIYLADMSSKSANYCCSYISGGHALLLLCEAELGAPMQTLTNASYDADETAKKGGMHSTWGQGTTGPVKWKDAGCIHESLQGVQMPDTTTIPTQTNVPNAYLQYNEYIAYDVAQVRLRYLLRVKM